MGSAFLEMFSEIRFVMGEVYMQKNKIITVQNLPITILKEDIDDYICITDIASAKSDDSRAADVIKNWIRNRNTLEFLGAWELIYNDNFKVVEFDHFKQQAGLHTFTLSVSEWIEKTNAIGVFVKRDAMVEHMLIRILLLSLHQQLVQFLNCT